MWIGELPRHWFGSELGSQSDEIGTNWVMINPLLSISQ